MSLTNEQEKQIKEQLMQQLENVPEESREKVKQQIKSMSKEQLIELIKQNKQEELSQQTEKIPDCIFCAIIKGMSKSIKIAENEEAIAILDINPISKGHTLIVLKEHNKEPTQKSQELAFEIGGVILEKLKPKDITTKATKIMEHTVLNVIPIYEGTDFEKRQKTTEEELVEVAKEISNNPVMQKPKIIKKEQVCILCEIAGEKTESIKIDENKENLAVLELNSISKAHSLVIPKKHIDIIKLPSSSFALAKKIAKKINTKFKPKEIKINPTSISEHSLIEIIPIYEDTDISKREKKETNELIKIQKKLIPRKRITKQKKENKSTQKRKYPKLPYLPPRIP